MPRISFQDVMPYKAADLYALVMDIEQYPAIFPDIKAIDAQQVAENVWDADVTIEAPFIDLRYSCRIEGTPPDGIDIRATGGAFKNMQARWRFTAQPDGHTAVSYDMDFDFGGFGLKNMVAEGFIKQNMTQMKDSIKAYAARQLTPVQAGDLAPDANNSGDKGPGRDGP